MKPIAFRIRDFRSITDSGVVPLSGDNITVLAGQNEAGKTAILLALRDFDLPQGDPSQTPEFMPEENFSAKPVVSVQFQFAQADASFLNGQHDIPEFTTQLLSTGTLWIERNVETGQFSWDSATDAGWSAALASRQLRVGPPAATSPTADDGTDSASADISEVDLEPPAEKENQAPPTKDDVLENMRLIWPTFVYFDTFSDTLPRQVSVDDLLALAADKKKGDVPQSVLDFLTLADVDPATVKRLDTQDKALGNYLQSRGASITGDFLQYWKQRESGEETVELHVKHVRDPSGMSKLAFFVHDKADQFPEQRSKGFLWFLSFFLRLAAETKRNPDRKRFLLIDEPGSYLHARAQRDVLLLFENRIAKAEPIIYSSHSIYLMPPDRLHRLRLVVKTREHGTRVYDRLTHPDIRGDEFADSLSPVIQSIGLDITQALSFARPLNLITEGITDYMYITNWAKLFRPHLLANTNIFPGTSATTVPTLASLFIGWGLPFAALVDRDAPGKKARDRLTKELLVPESRVLQPQNALGIEDLFSEEDSRQLLSSLDNSLTLLPEEAASAAIKRQKVDKVLLARTYAERVGRGETELSAESKQRIERFLDDIGTATAQQGTAAPTPPRR